MSRSFKKNWIVTDNYGSSYKKFAKRQANKRIRKSESVPDGKAYRKFFESWDICDYKIHYSQNFFYNEVEDSEYSPEIWKYRNK